MSLLKLDYSMIGDIKLGAYDYSKIDKLKVEGASISMQVPEPKAFTASIYSRKFYFLTLSLYLFALSF